MNYDYLKYILQLNNTPSKLFSLVGGLPNESVCIENHNNHWGVYYSERGKRNNFTEYDCEDDACNAFLELLLSTNERLNAGRLSIDKNNTYVLKDGWYNKGFIILNIGDDTEDSFANNRIAVTIIPFTSLDGAVRYVEHLGEHDYNVLSFQVSERYIRGILTKALNLGEYSIQNSLFSNHYIVSDYDFKSALSSILRSFGRYR